MSIPKIASLSRRQIENEVAKNYDKVRIEIANLIWSEINEP